MNIILLQNFTFMYIPPLLKHALTIRLLLFMRWWWGPIVTHFSFETLSYVPALLLIVIAHSCTSLNHLIHLCTTLPQQEHNLCVIYHSIVTIGYVPALVDSCPPDSPHIPSKSLITHCLTTARAQPVCVLFVMLSYVPALIDIVAH